MRAFVLTSGHQRGDEAAASLVTAMPEILQVIKHVEPPFIFGVSREGKTRRLL